MNWKVMNNVLTYHSDSGEITVPDASMIYAACISHAKKDDDNLPYELIQKDLPDIHFSRIAQDVRICLDVSSGKIKIRLSVFSR